MLQQSQQSHLKDHRQQTLHTQADDNRWFGYRHCRNVEENAINMALGGLLMEVKKLQFILSQKGLLVTMIPKNTDLSYIQEHVQ